MKIISFGIAANLRIHIAMRDLRSSFRRQGRSLLETNWQASINDLNEKGGRQRNFSWVSLGAGACMVPWSRTSATDMRVTKHIKSCILAFRSVLSRRMGMGSVIQYMNSYGTLSVLRRDLGENPPWPPKIKFVHRNFPKNQKNSFGLLAN